MTPKVSVVIPMYNSATTVGGTITGALTQTYRDVEVVVVDDGSTDDSAIVAEGYGARIHLIRKENGGVSSARNAGAEAATGDLLLFCDADDIMLPGCVEAAVEAWTDRGPNVGVTLNSFFMRADGLSRLRVPLSGPTPRGDRQRMLLLQSNYCASHILAPRHVFDSLGGFDETLRSLEDWDFWIRCVFSGFEIVRVMKPTILYRWSTGSLSADHDQMLRDERALFEKIQASATPLGLRADEREYVRVRLAEGSPRARRFAADDALAEGDFRRAARLYREAARLSPGDLKLQARRWTVGTVPGAAQLWRRRQSGPDRAY